MIGFPEISRNYFQKLTEKILYDNFWEKILDNFWRKYMLISGKDYSFLHSFFLGGVEPLLEFEPPAFARPVGMFGEVLYPSVVLGTGEEDVGSPH